MISVNASQGVILPIVSPLAVLLAVAGVLGSASASLAETPCSSSTAEKGSQKAEKCSHQTEKLDPLAQPTAIALNYCRASFHRIQKTPSKRVLLEEQEKILNNLNINPIADEEIIRLYTAVLAEIAEVQIADHERDVIETQHRRAVMHELALSALAISGQAASMQYVGALKTGAQSWWDYRSLVFEREVDLWRVDKSRLVAFTDKSSLFLDTFWKLARKRGIPDQWLIRGNDLDRLADALEEPRAEVRLRVLRRMERFMECYPPYWYYVARTQQALGQFTEALETYHRLASLGDQYFRKDEMLAAALANQALIEDYLGQESALETARQALDFSTDVWEVNLMCGVLLLKRGQIAEAEDAILRNLDVNLETQQSLVALLAVYHVSQDARKLEDRLSKPRIARKIPAPLLLECVGVLGTGNVPQATRSQLLRSLAGDFDRHFGPDDFRLEATPGWQLDRAKITLSLGETRAGDPAVSMDSDKHKLRFPKIANVGNMLKPRTQPTSLTLTLKYPETEALRIHLQPISSRAIKHLAGDKKGSIRRPLLSSKDYRVVAVDLHGGRVQLVNTKTPLPALAEEEPKPTIIPAAVPLDDPNLPVVPAF